MVSSKKTSDYDITAEFIVNHTKKTFNQGNDVSDALWTLVKSDTDIWKPKIKISSDPNVNIKKREDKQFVMDYKSKWLKPWYTSECTNTIRINCMPCYGEDALSQFKIRLNQDRTTIVWYTTTQLHHYKQSSNTC